MKKSKVIIAVTMLALALSACCRATRQQLIDRVAFDLSCPKEQLQVSEIDLLTNGVIGCGKRAAYVESCQDEGHRCTWVLNTNGGRELLLDTSEEDKGNGSPPPPRQPKPAQFK